MPTFTGSFQIEGDATALPATVSINDDKIRLSSRSHLIGEWSLGDIIVDENGSRVVLTVEGERVHLDLSDHNGFMSATGILRKPPTSRIGRRKGREDALRQVGLEPDPRSAAKPRRSIRDVVSGWMRELRPDFDEVTDRARSVRASRSLWIGLTAFALAVIFIPTVVVLLLTIGGALATLVATFGYLDNSIRVRFPNRFPPIIVLAMGVGLLVLAAVIGAIR